MADAVQLTDLDVIARYSIAVRSATADRDELLETLRADLAWLERGRHRSSTASYRPSDDAVEVDVIDDEDEEYAEPSRPQRATAPRARKTTATKRATARRTTR